MLPALLLGVAYAPLSIYVSANGNDAGTGTSSAPFATLTRAQAELKRLAPSHPPVTVHLKGEFYLDAPLELGKEATGVTFVGPVTLSGATPLRHWHETDFLGHRVWAADVAPGSDFHELFVGPKSERAERPHLPKSGYQTFAGYDTASPGGGDWMLGQSSMKYRNGDLKTDWHNLNDVELVVHQLWVTSRLPIAKLDPSVGVVTFGKKSVFRLDGSATGTDSPFVVENVAEALDAGQWYLDRPSNTIYYLPRPGDRRERFVAFAPHIPAVVRVKGAQGTVFQNLTFVHCEYNLPADSSGDLQAANGVPGAVQISDSQGVKLTHCRIEHVGTYGVQIEGTASKTVIDHCTMTDLGAGGVKIDDNSSGNTVSDCDIEHGGRFFASAIGVLVKLSGDNEIIHNRIRDFYYTGISVGWDWGFRDTPAHNNHIAYNEISEIGQNELSDMGGIYVLGKQPGSRMDHNRIQNVSARTYGGWGIYLDEGSTGWTVEDNVAMHTKTGGFHIHYGGDNVIRNNIFAYARQEGQLIRQRDDKQGPIRFEHDFVVASPGDAPIVVPNWLKRAVTMTGMLYSAPKTTLPFGDDGTGQFVEAKLDSGGLPPRNSPVFRLGFRPIDLRTIGPRN